MGFLGLSASASSVLVASLLVIGLAVLPYGLGIPAARGLVTNPPVVGVWSNACGSYAIASNNTSCGNLTAGNSISVQINITNAPVGSVNGYEFFLYYDPAFLNATRIDVSTETVFPYPSLIFNELALRGEVHVLAVCLGCGNTSDNGVLVNILFKILGTGVSPISLAAGMVPSGFAQSFTVLTGLLPSRQVVEIGPITSDGYFTNVAGNTGPVASFTFSPKVFQGSTVTFNASGSYDPDASINAPNGGISLYEWDFGGASSLSQPTKNPILIIPLGSVFGNFSVRLTVVDSDDGFEGIQTQPLTISEAPFAFAASPTILTIIKGASGTTNLTLTSLNGFSGTVTLSATLSPIISKSPTTSLNPSTVTLPTDGMMDSVLTVSTGHPTRTGNYIVTITATSGTFALSIQILVTVNRK